MLIFKKNKKILHTSHILCNINLKLIPRSLPSAPHHGTYLLQLLFALQADVYINSTNTNMDLKQGQLSKLLLNACGDELQRECSEYAPLKPGQVAVTGARNLKCQHIFHIALADYKMASSERVSYLLGN